MIVTVAIMLIIIIIVIVTVTGMVIFIIISVRITTITDINTSDNIQFIQFMYIKKWLILLKRETKDINVFELFLKLDVDVLKIMNISTLH